MEATGRPARFGTHAPLRVPVLTYCRVTFVVREPAYVTAGLIGHSRPLARCFTRLLPTDAHLNPTTARGRCCAANERASGKTRVTSHALASSRVSDTRIPSRSRRECGQRARTWHGSNGTIGRFRAAGMSR